jgi:thiol-disulfide isomerase/thioredoxin
MIGTMLLFLLAGLVLSQPARVRAATGAGDTFPALASFEALRGTLPETSGRVVLVDFWASWCAPCKASFPAYGRLQTEFAPKGLVIIAVSVDENPADFESFARRFNPQFTVVLDRGHKLVRAVQVPTMPTSYLIDREGRVRYVHQGFHGAATEQALRREIRNLLPEKSP